MVDVAIVGGGMAGLASAWHLARAGAEVCLLEQEAMCATHSSGKNAAIFRHLEPDPALARLARRSRALLDDLLGDGWLDPVGAVYVGRDGSDLAVLIAAAAAAGVEHELLTGGALAAFAPALRIEDCPVGVATPWDGVIDIHRVTSGLLAEARRRGSGVRTRARVRSVLVDAGRTTGLLLEDGSSLAAGRVVIAGGAWASTLGATAGAPLPLVPLRRHLVVLDRVLPRGDRPRHPVVWRVVDEVYFREEAGGTLASPCDEAPWPPGVPPPHDEALLPLAEKLAEAAPGLADAAVRARWACLRTFAPDRNLVIGEDPRIRGLWWLAGLGGHGMTLGAAAGEVLAHAMAGEPCAPDASAFLPGRLLEGERPREAAPAAADDTVGLRHAG